MHKYLKLKIIANQGRPSVSLHALLGGNRACPVGETLILGGMRKHGDRMPLTQVLTYAN
jgi:hypothetical protein